MVLNGFVNVFILGGGLMIWPYIVLISLIAVLCLATSNHLLALPSTQHNILGNTKQIQV